MEISCQTPTDMKQQQLSQEWPNVGNSLYHTGVYTRCNAPDRWEMNAEVERHIYPQLPEVAIQLIKPCYTHTCWVGGAWNRTHDLAVLWRKLYGLSYSDTLTTWNENLQNRAFKIVKCLNK